MAYCTIAQIEYLTGTALADADLTEMIAQADAEINARLTQYGLTSGSGDELELAALKLVSALIYNRYRLDGTKPASLTIGGISMGDNIDEAIKNLRAEALNLIDIYGRRTSADPKMRGYYVYLG